MVSSEFLITALIVVLIPGTGVIYTVSTGLFSGKRASIFAALGCTFGILPHIGASVLGLAALLHVSAVAFQVIKFFGVAYLLFLAWSMWRDSGRLLTEKNSAFRNPGQIALRGFLINILNPKLSLFFLAFLPQFIPASSESGTASMLALGGIFMILTLLVFVIYGLLAGRIRGWVLTSEQAGKCLQKGFAILLAGMAGRLAVVDR